MSCPRLLPSAVFSAGAAWMMAAALFALPACADNAATGAAPADADAEMRPDTGSRRDLPGEAQVQVSNCQTARTVCVDKDVHLCSDGRPGELLETCAYACSLGRCTSAACANVEQSQGLQGCRFYGAQMDNIDAEDGRSTALFLSNPGSQSVHAQIQVRTVTGDWVSMRSLVVQSAHGVRAEWSRPLPDPGVTSAGAFRLESDGPLLVVQIVDDNADRNARSTGGTVLRPLQALGARYLALTAPAAGNAAVIRTAGSRAGAAALSVIATAPNTHVQLKLTVPAIVDGVTVQDPTGAPYEVPVMDEGDVLQVFSATAGGDLTGTELEADVSVAAFSGNIYTTYGYDLTGFNGADMAMEQLPPTGSWGLEYVGARLAPQADCDSFFGPGVALWRVMAAQPDTLITIVPAPNVAVDLQGAAADGDLVPFTLGAGEFRTFRSRPTDGDPTAPADVLVTGAHPILLAQWMDCEPALAWGIDTRLSSGMLSFTLPPGYEHELVVVKKVGEDLLLNGGLLAEGRFTRAAGNREYEVTRVRDDELGPCRDMFDRCDHALAGTGFGVSWRGMDVVCGYALTVPSSQLCALPNVDCEP